MDLDQAKAEARKAWKFINEHLYERHRGAYIPDEYGTRENGIVWVWSYETQAPHVKQLDKMLRDQCQVAVSRVKKGLKVWIVLTKAIDAEEYLNKLVWDEFTAVMNQHLAEQAA